MPSEDISRSLELLEKVMEHAPQSDVRLQNYLAALKSSIETDSKGQEEAKRLLAEYEEAYAKLTAPANRLGVFLQWLENAAKKAEDSEEGPALPSSEKLALIAVGDQEFVANVDRRRLELKRGLRITTARA